MISTASEKMFENKIFNRFQLEFELISKLPWMAELTN